MRLITIAILTLAALLLGNCTKDPLLPGDDWEAGSIVTDLPSGGFEPGWVRVKFTHLDESLNTMLKRGGVIYTGITEFDELALTLGVTGMQRVFSDGGRYAERRKRYGLHLWYDLYVGEDRPLSDPLNRFAALPVVEVAELIPVIRESTDGGRSSHSSYADRLLFPLPLPLPLAQSGGDGHSFNDPLLPRQWHYHNDGSTASSVAGADARIFDAWTITTGDPRVIVAVVDGGIDYTHPDLAANMWINTGEIPGNGIDDDGNGYVDDIYGYRWTKSGLPPAGGNIIPMDHGSHCAGTIAAVNNNGIGLAGVAGGNGNPATGVRLMSCQTYVPDPEKPEDPYGNSASTSQTPDAFAYAADNGAVIVSCSFTYGGTSLSAAYKAGIDYFVDNAGTDENGNQTGPMKGGLMVGAAGNDGEILAKYPASYEKVISVAYSMSNYKKSPSSNYGPSIDVTAPGGATSSSYAPGRVGGIFSTIPMASGNFDVQQGYAYKSGTSMAAPHVAGVAALILSAAVENDIPMTAGKLRSIIERSCFSLDQWNPEYVGMLGRGQIDAGHAIEILLGGDEQPLQPPANIKTTSELNSITVTWDTPADYLGHPVKSTETFISLSPLEGVNLATPPAGVRKEVVSNTKAPGERAEKRFSSLDEDHEYYFALISVDRYDQKSEPVFFSARTKAAGTTGPDGRHLFMVYPSRTSGELFIAFPVSVHGKKVEITIYNSVGYVVWRHEVIGGTAPYRALITRLAGGVYTVVLRSGDSVEKHSIIKY